MFWDEILLKQSLIDVWRANCWTPSILVWFWFLLSYFHHLPFCMFHLWYHLQAARRQRDIKVKEEGYIQFKLLFITFSFQFPFHIYDIFFHFVINQREIGRLGQVAYWRGGSMGSMGSPKVMEVGRSGQGGNRFGMSAGAGEEFAEGKWEKGIVQWAAGLVQTKRDSVPIDPSSLFFLFPRDWGVDWSILFLSN